MSSAEIFRRFNDVLGGRLRRVSSATDGDGSQLTPHTSLTKNATGKLAITPVPTITTISAEHAATHHAQSFTESNSAGLTADAVTVTNPGDMDGQDNINDDEEKSDRENRQSWIPAVKKLVQFNDLRNNERVVPIESFAQVRRKRVKNKRVAVDQFGEYSVVARKVLSIDLRLTDYRLEIQSKPLRSIFRKIAKPFKDIDLDGSPILIRYPFKSLFFLRQDLKELLETDITASTKEEITHLVDFIETEPSLRSIIKEYEATVPRGKFREDLTWTLFRPHDLVYYSTSYVGSSKFRYDGCGFVDKVETGMLSGTSTEAVRINFAVGHHTGTSFGIVQTSETLPANTTDIRDINIENLPVIPMRFLPPADQEKIKTKMCERGKKYVKYSTADFTMLEYRGPVAVQSEASEKMISEFGKATGGMNLSWETNQRVVIDNTVQRELGSLRHAFDRRLVSPSIRHHLGQVRQKAVDLDGDERKALHADIGGLPNDLDSDQSSDSSSSSSESSGSSSDSSNSGIFAFKFGNKDVELMDEDYLICHPGMVCFLLRNRIWVGMLVSGLSEIKWRSDPYVHLQLAEEKKTLIRNLVAGFGTDVAQQRPESVEDQCDDDVDSEDEFDDFIVGKGKGLLFVLHGAPGLGKTLTAESVAESTRRPLYHVSAGELDVDVNKLEEQLTKIFRLGRRWGAVVLLDEADVLMTQRNSAELQRNAIVAVFLRMIEYYQGMLFLTTNRLAEFDPAFFNRVHITIKYGNLGPDERRNIWRQHVQRACRRSRKPYLWNEDAYRLLGSIETNGREIRNLTRTAVGFAQSMDQDLDITHVVAVIRNNLGEMGNQDLGGIFAELKAVHERLLEERPPEIIVEALPPS